MPYNPSAPLGLPRRFFLRLQQVPMIVSLHARVRTVVALAVLFLAGAVAPAAWAQQLSIGDVSVAEGDSGTKLATFTVSLSAPQPNPVLFDVATADGSATAGSDYVSKALTGQRIIIGAVSKTFTVTINGDTTQENDETFLVNVTNPFGASIADGQATGTITNDDAAGPPPSLSITDVSIAEGDWNMTKLLAFKVTLSAPASSTVTFNIATANGSAVAGEDYTALALTNQSIPAGATSATFNVSILGDGYYEGNENFALNVTNVVGATVADGSATGTISNDDIAPSISIGDASLQEGDEGTQWATFIITASGTNPNPTTFDITTSDGTAVGGSDYTPLTQHFDIPAGSSGSYQIHVDVLGDRQFEADETFNVTLSNVTGGATFTDNQAVGLIQNDDPDLTGAPSLSIGDVTITEGNVGTKIATFTVQLSKPLTATMNFGLNVDGVTATAGVDFDQTGLNGWMGPGESSRTFEVTIRGDYTYEPDETFTVTAVNVDGANVADGQAVGTILNDDAVPPTMSIGDASVSEGNSGLKTMTFPVTLSKPAPSQVCFLLQITGGTATVNLDYQGITVQPCIPAGQSGYNFNVSIIGDTANEPDETLLVSTSQVSGAELLDGTAIGTITNDDSAGLPNISIGDVTIVEGNSGSSFAAFTVTLSAPAAANVTFNAATSDGTATVANSDYVAQNWSLVIPAGSTTLSLQVPVTGDTNFEQDETFAINLSSVVGASVADGSATGSITNDDVASGPTLSITNQVISYEGNSGTTQAVFTLQLSAPASTDVTYDIATINNTATAPSDFVAKSLVGQTIPAGQTSKTFSVTINGDTAVEFDEVYIVEVSNVTGAVMPNNQSIAKIRNDDGVPALSISDVSISEGDSGTKMANFTLSLSAPSSTWVQVDVNTADGSATVGSDYYQQSPQGFGISPGLTSATLGVEIIGDTTFEANETFTVKLSNVINATIADGQATGTITNDDPPALSIADVSISEGNSGAKTATFTVLLSGAAPSTVNFDIATANGTATAGSDYVAISLAGQTIAAGQASKTFSVTINGDTTVEPNETFTVTVSNVSGATVGDGSATGTITNDDSEGGPTLSIGDVSITEGNSLSKQATFTVKLSAASASAVTYSIATANGTAVSGTDYVAKSLVGQSMPAGTTSKTFTVGIKGDTVAEPDETFLVNLSSAVGATVADGQAIGTITNDDGGGGGTPTLSIADLSIAEGNSGTKVATFTVSLSAAAAGAVTYNIATANGTATSGSDYVANSLTSESIAAGATSKTFAVTINGDTTTEPDETFTVALSSVVGATLGDGSATGTISNDDGGGGGSPTLSIGDVSITEGNAFSKQATFTVTLSATASGAVTYNIATANGTAIAGTDYVAKALTGQSIAAGTTSKIFTVGIKGDAVAEPNETFTVNVSSVVGATLGDGQAIGTIVNDDAAAITVGRVVTGGLYDNIDDGNRELVLTGQEYASLLLETATRLCARTNTATIVAVEDVENRAVLMDLADAANANCPSKPRYAAVMAAGDSRGFLVEATAKGDARGVQVLGPPTMDASAKLTSLQVQSPGDVVSMTLLMPQALSANQAAKPTQLRSLGQWVQSALKADPRSRLVLIGGVTVPGLLDLTARSLPAKSALPGERVLVSRALLEAFGASTVLFPALPAAGEPAQVLQLQR